MSREAMKLALDMLNEIADDVYCDQKLEGVITALRQALETEQESVRLQCTTCGTVYADGLPPQVARPEQEPVAFINVEKQKLEWAKLTSWHTPTVVNLPKIPLYTAPPKREWIGLTDEEIDVIYEQHHNQYGECESPNFGYERAIEQALKEKNT